MIFVTFGNVPLPFTRLAAEVERVACILEEEVFVQQGHTHFSFSRARAVPFVDSETMQRSLAEASIVVTHGGWGTLVEALKMGKKIVAVPRRLGTEHNHSQEELVHALEECGYLLGVYKIERLLPAIEAARIRLFQNLVRGDAGDIINTYLSKAFLGERS